MRVLLGLLVLQLLFLLNFMVAVEGSHKYLPLPPLFAKNIKHFAKEPSGLTYCASTDRLYLNCDKSSCHYIYEMDTEANPIETLEFSDSHHDIEAIACNDKEGYLYIAEEGHRKVQAFYLDDYSTKDGQKQLKEAYSFRVVTGNSTSSRSGLEGMTVNTKTGDIYVANEKGPAMIVRCHENGEQYESNIIEYARDISGLAYDDQLDLLWVLSDQNEQVFLTDLTGTIVYDYWDLPVANPEGIAINNNAKPPKLYIATDPSAPSGPQYVPLVLGFDKPENGTGYATWDHKHLPKYVTDPPPCHGCHDVFEEAYNNGFERAYYWEDHFPEAKSANLTVILVSVLVPIGSCCLLAVLAVICAVVIARRMKRKKGLPVAQEDPDLENELVFTSEEKDSSLLPDETEV